MKTIPHQSFKALFPGSAIAARELGVHRAHLHRVLRGDRVSKVLSARWNEWLSKNPHFENLNRKAS
jgi:hypothetical protein